MEEQLRAATLNLQYYAAPREPRNIYRAEQLTLNCADQVN